VLHSVRNEVYTQCPRKTVTLDNVRWKWQIRTHPNQIGCAWLRIYLWQNCPSSSENIIYYTTY